MKALLKTHWPAILVLLIALIIGLDIYQDYGVSIDEKSQREIGFTAWMYANGKFPGPYTNYWLRDHGPGFEWVYLFAEKAFHATSFRDIFLTRHLVTYLFFVFTMIFGYVWIYRVFKDRWLATFGLAALLFHPVIFGHAFFNPKDIPAMCTFLVSLSVAHIAFEKQKPLLFLVLGLVVGYSCTIRLLNIFILAPVALFFLIDLVSSLKQRTNPGKIVLSGLLLCIGTCITLYACWPTLWENPVEGLRYAYNTSAEYPWNFPVLFAGHKILATQLPWSYIPTWFFITTPELFLLLGIIGMIMLVARIIENPAAFYVNTPQRSILMAFFCFLVPIIIVIVIDAVLYDSWRHMYFIYPSFVMLMIFGLNELLKKRRKIIIWSLCLLQLVLIADFCRKNHPFEHVYFNSFLSHDENYLMEHYELDYWGTGHKQGLEWLAEHDERYGIKIFMDIWTLKDNYKFLNDPMHAKFILTWNIFEAEYVLEFFRTNTYVFPNKDAPESRIIYEKKVLGSPVYRIVKLR